MHPSGLEIIRTPFRVPQANGVAERFVRTVRSECLDWLLILDHQHLERVLDVFVEHYNGHRPHRALGLTPPRPARPAVATACGETRVQRRDRLGGVVHEYVLARDQIVEPYTIRRRHPFGADTVQGVVVRMAPSVADVVDNRDIPDICLQQMLSVMLIDKRASFKAAHTGTHADGTRLSERVEAVRGMPRNPIEVIGKARDLIAPIFGAGATTRLVDAAFGLESMTSVRALRPL